MEIILPQTDVKLALIDQNKDLESALREYGDFVPFQAGQKFSEIFLAFKNNPPHLISVSRGLKMESDWTYNLIAKITSRTPDVHFAFYDCLAKTLSTTFRPSRYSQMIEDKLHGERKLYLSMERLGDNWKNCILTEIRRGYSRKN